MVPYIVYPMPRGVSTSVAKFSLGYMFTPRDGIGHFAIGRKATCVSISRCGISWAVGRKTPGHGDLVKSHILCIDSKPKARSQVLSLEDDRTRGYRRSTVVAPGT